MKSLLNEQSIATFKEQIESLSQENHALKEKNDQLRRQVEWFKNQIFGRKSEKRIPPPPPEQLTLGEGFERGGDKPQTITVRGFARGKAPKDRTDAVSEAGLRFDDSVPVREIRLLPVEAKGLSSEQYEVVSEKVNYRLAQRPATKC